MKIMVTGCAGFIGSHLTEALLADGHSVVGVDDMRSGDERNLPDRHHLFQLLRIDCAILQPADMVGCTAIFHQAASGSVPRSIDQPTGTLQNNVMGFQRVLDCAREIGVKRLVYASSSSVHGLGAGQLLSPYAMTKRMNEMQADQYNRHYDMQCIGLRYFNVFGPRQNPESPYAAVIPRFVRALGNGSPLIIYGDGRQSRDFTYVKNVVDANILAMASTFQPHMNKFDIGNGNSHSINFLASELEQMLGKRSERVHERERKGDVPFSKANIGPAIQFLGYDATWGLQAGLYDWLIRGGGISVRPSSCQTPLG